MSSVLSGAALEAVNAAATKRLLSPAITMLSEASRKPAGSGKYRKSGGVLY